MDRAFEYPSSHSYNTTQISSTTFIKMQLYRTEIALVTTLSTTVSKAYRGRVQGEVPLKPRGGSFAHECGLECDPTLRRSDIDHPLSSQEDGEEGFA